MQEVRQLPITELVVGSGQARVRNVDLDVQELAESIRVHGLLEPIVVHPLPEGGYEVLMGQRRLLAHRELGRQQILALIVEQPVDEETAKALSLTENMVRRDLDAKDLIDACTALYRKYGSARAVAEETGLPYPQVLKHIKYARLVPELRALVDEGEVKLGAALKAQDAAGLSELSGRDETVKLAKGLSSMTLAQQHQAVRARREDPGASVEEVVERAATSWASKQIIVTLTGKQHEALQAYAKARGITQDTAAAQLVAAGLEALEQAGASERHVLE